MSMCQIESFPVSVVFQDLDKKLLPDKDVAAVQFGTVVRGFEQLLSEPHRNERVEVQISLIQSLQL